MMTPAERARRYLENCPAAVSGDGGHATAFAVIARVCKGFNLSGDDALAALTDWNSRCSPPWTAGELRHKINSALASPGPRGFLLGDNARSLPTPAPPPAAPRTPELDHAAIARATESGLGLPDLLEASPLRFDDGPPPPSFFLDHLFPADPYLCLGADHLHMETRLKSEWTADPDALAAMNYIIPARMRGPLGTTKEGRPSPSSLNNILHRDFIILEGDDTTPDQQAGVILYLIGKGITPKIVVHSGGKSLHAWFPVTSESDAQTHLRLFCTIGGDEHYTTPRQSTRFPFGTNPKTGSRQTVFYFQL